MDTYWGVQMSSGYAYWLIYWLLALKASKGHVAMKQLSHLYHVHCGDQTAELLSNTDGGQMLHL